MMESAAATQSVEADLGEQQLLCLRRIDHAIARSATADIDTEVTAILANLQDASRGHVTLYDPLTDSCPWGFELPEPHAEQPRTFEVSIGLPSQALLLMASRHRRRITLAPRWTFIHAASVQLSNLFESHFERLQNRWLDALEADFLDLDLHPQACLAQMAKHLNTLFPSMALFHSARSEVIQLVMRANDDDDMLMISSSTGREVGTYIERADSMVGVVFEAISNPSPPRYRIESPDSPTWTKQYKGFAQGIQSELVAALRTTDGKTVAALNFECTDANAYGQREVSYIRGLAPRLTKLVAALGRQKQSDDHSRMGIVAAQSHYWETVGRLMAHDVTNPAGVIKGRLEDLDDLIVAAADPDTELGGVLEEMSDISKSAQAKLVEQLDIVEDFKDQFRDYLHFGPMDVARLCAEARRFATKGVGPRVRSKSIRISEIKDDSCQARAYASPLLRIFIYNVLENSLQWLDMLPDDAPRGSILMHLVDYAPEPASGVAELNRYLRVMIEDNGPGAPQEVYDALNDPVPRTISMRPGGQGYALRALKDYITGIGGVVFFCPSPSGGFKTVIDLRLVHEREEEQDGGH